MCRRFISSVFIAVVVPLIAPGSASAGHGSTLRYEVTASKGRVNGEVIGPVIATVEGVPAEPVDSFTWDGIGSCRV